MARVALAGISLASVARQRKHKPRSFRILGQLCLWTPPPAPRVGKRAPRRDAPAHAEADAGRCTGPRTVQEGSGDGTERKGHPQITQIPQISAGGMRNRTARPGQAEKRKDAKFCGRRKGGAYFDKKLRAEPPRNDTNGHGEEKHPQITQIAQPGAAATQAN